MVFSTVGAGSLVVGVIGILFHRVYGRRKKEKNEDVVEIENGGESGKEMEKGEQI